jgi:hypothetical protein
MPVVRERLGDSSPAHDLEGRMIDDPGLPGVAPLEGSPRFLEPLDGRPHQEGRLKEPPSQLLSLFTPSDQFERASDCRGQWQSDDRATRLNRGSKRPWNSRTMDEKDRRLLISLIRERSLAALGTIFDGGPLVSLVLYACEPDLSSLYLHVSRLAQHTRGLLSQPRVGLLISEPDRASRNPLTLARVSIQGLAGVLPDGSPEFGSARDLYLAAHPTAAINFDLPDFVLLRLHPHSARFIAGFGKIFDLDRAAWANLTATAIVPGADAGPSDRGPSFRPSG